MKQNGSHLYEGFRYAGVLPCIARQRSIQASLLSDLAQSALPRGRFLSIGVAWGDELRTLLENGQASRWQGIDTIDLAVRSTEAMRKLAADFRLRSRLEHRVMDLADLAGHSHYGQWAVIQCGFVLQDIAYKAKQDIYDLLYGGLLPGGVLVISEMYIDNRPRNGSADHQRRQEVLRLYNVFMRETDRCLKTGVLSRAAYKSLYGSEDTPGICSAKNGALEGVRDYFETKRQVVKHLRLSGFSSVQYFRNPQHPALGVIVSVKAPFKGAKCRLPISSKRRHV